MIILKSDREIIYHRDADWIAAETLVEIKKAVKPDVTALELDQNAEEYIKGFNGFPASITSSLNEEVMHGNPGLRKLNYGDNVSIDIGALFDRSIHEDSQMPKFGEPGRGTILKTGRTLCIAGDRLEILTRL